MIHRTNTPASDLRARAEQVRAGNKLFPPTTRTAPTEQGERLATAERGDIAIRRHEMATLAEGVAAALDRFDAMPKQDGAR